MNTSQFKITIVVYIFINSVTSCLITNCPRGGKRAGSDNNLIEAVRSDMKTCTPCGPNNLGVCIGRDLCCGKHLGCLISSPNAKICRRVREFPESCLSSFNPCGNGGLCVARNVCCSKSQCRIDDSCKSIPYVDFNRPFGTSDILNRLSSYSMDYPLELTRNYPVESTSLDEIWGSKEESIVPNFNFKIEAS